MSGRIDKKIIIQIVIGIGIILFLLQLADLDQTFAAILQANPLNLALAAAFFVISSVFVGFALYAPLRQSNPKTSVRKVVMASFAGQLLSDVTPARVGYFFTPLFLDQLAGIPISQGMAGVLATGGINALMKAAICLLGIAYFASFLAIEGAILNALFIGVAILLVLGTILLILMWEKRLSTSFAKLEKIPLIGKLLRRLADLFANVQQEGRKIKRPLVMVAAFILVSLVINAAALYFVFGGVWGSYPLSILDFFFMAALASVLMYIPITIAGLGFQEAFYVLFLQLLLGFPLTSIDPRLLAFALTTRALFTGTDIIGLYPMLKAGLKRDNAVVPSATEPQLPTKSET